MPQLEKQKAKIISLVLFAATSVVKLLCIFILSGQANSLCIAGWHFNEELAINIIFVTIGLIPDIIMLLCIGAGMAFTASNIGADPGTIVYNFVVGLLSIGSFFPFLGSEDCKSENFTKIKMIGIYAALAGVLHIVNGVICLINIAPEEKIDPDEQDPSSSPGSRPNTGPSTSKAARSK